MNAETHPAWRRVQLARHPKRPHSLDYIEKLFTDFQEFHGDRAFGDDLLFLLRRDKDRFRIRQIMEDFQMP